MSKLSQIRVGSMTYNINASYVNNHTVNSDVPTNAVFTDTTYSIATRSANGLMSSTDKSKLDGIVLTITSTDPGEGSVLATGSLVFVTES